VIELVVAAPVLLMFGLSVVVGVVTGSKIRRWRNGRN